LVFFVDFHIHSKYSGGTSKKMDLEHLARYGPLKGLNLIGTGDITHPDWFTELKEKLTSTEGSNLFSFNNMRFILTGEVNTVFEYEGKSKQIHHLLLVPNFEVASQLNDDLSKFGKLASDGRPNLRMTPAELIEIMNEVDKDIECIPAHIWTTYFSVLGARGFNSLKDCYQDKIQKIHALETGLSSDLPMNWRISELDDYILVSNSDCHSPWPWRIGREVNVFDIDEMTYSNLIDAIRKKNTTKFPMTIEVNPAYGKYHYDGHRKGRIYYKDKKKLEHEQGVRMHPSHAIGRTECLCPICNKSFTIGVLHRVEELADREEGYKPLNAQDFKTLIPLSEIIATAKGIVTLYAQGVWSEYQELINSFGNEFEVLLNTSLDELLKVTTTEIADTILKVRQCQVQVSPGYDGEYGRLVLDGMSDTNNVLDYVPPPQMPEKTQQMSLDEFK